MLIIKMEQNPKERTTKNHLASFRNYAVEPKFDVQLQINIRKSKEEIAFEQDVENLFTKEDEENLFIEEDVDNILPEQQVKQESPDIESEKRKGSVLQDSFDGEGVFHLPG